MLMQRHVRCGIACLTLFANAPAIALDWTLLDACTQTQATRLQDFVPSEPLDDSDPAVFEFSPAADCPDLIAAIETSAWAWQAHTPTEHLRLQDINNIYALDDFYTNLTPRAAPGTGDLADVLDALPREQANVSWSEQIMAWLRERLASDDGTLDSDWLRDWQMPEEAAVIVQYTLIVMVVLTAIAIIANEWRLSRSGRRRPIRERFGRTHASQTVPANRFLGDDPLEWPSELLAMMLTRVSRALKIHSRSSLTHRQIQSHQFAEFTPVMQRLAAAAELHRYSEQRLTTDELTDLRQAGEQALASAEARHAAAQTRPTQSGSSDT